MSVAAALVALGLITVLAVRAATHNTGSPTTTTAGGTSATTAPPPRTIEMDQATGASCGRPVPPGPGHPDRVLSQIFNVHDKADTPYLLGWTIVPYRGSDRSYRFGVSGDVLALQPPAGGRPLGYGTGTVTLGSSPEAGTIDAVVKLKAGGVVTVEGVWQCIAST